MSKQDLNYFTKRIKQIDNSLPAYMRKNLTEMPNNKGYIWKGCWYLGHKNEEPNQPVVIFEKCRGGILRIHEYSDTEYKLYEKQGKNRKKIVRRKRRVRQLNAPSKWVDV
uniref:Uncharacterized protein n=1 Tax=viral metagenome TaxID=1070528 RepID=A0A6C0EJH1_9ZZZZ